MVPLLIAVTFCVFLVSFSSVRNILWLMTAAINTALDFHDLFAYRAVFGLQILVIFTSVFSISWNLCSVARYIAKDG
ncbi:MAG: hypothetical protein WC544_02210 [Patescibacteria group bacterium]